MVDRARGHVKKNDTAWAGRGEFMEENKSRFVIRRKRGQTGDLLCFGGFREYLAEKAVVRERYVPYFVRWAAECYAFLELPLENRLSSDQRQEFLRYLSKRHED
jgi:hypothetical protein